MTEESDKIQDHPVYQAEQKLLELAASRLTILRLAGLIGENRHPVKYFIQKNRIPNSNAPVNLVHQKDVIHAILLVLKNEIFGEIFNIVNPSHLSKKDYYLAAAKELFNENPITEDGPGGKLVLGTKFEEETGFKYQLAIDNWSEFLKTV
jgi:nucleoside-diphosphate-sugar epimerase